MKIIKINQNKEIIIDDEDYEWAMQWKWHYSARYVNRDVVRHKKQVKLHRELLKKYNKNIEGMEIDHINGNTLDNRKENLRIVTHQQNMFNQKKPSNNTTGYKGVGFDKTGHFRNKKWRASITINGKWKNLGRFTTREEAAQVRIQAEEKYYGEYRTSR